MADINDHTLREIRRLIQYLDPGQSLLTMPMTRRLEHANKMVEQFWPGWASERNALENIFEEGNRLAEDLSPPLEVTSTSTGWVAIGACLLVGAPIAYTASKHFCGVLGKYFASPHPKQTPAASESRHRRKTLVEIGVNQTDLSTSTSDSDSVTTDDSWTTAATPTSYKSDCIKESMVLVIDRIEGLSQRQSLW